MQYKHFKKANHIFFFIIMLLALLYVGEGFLVPLIFAMFIGALMEPVADKLQNFGMNNFFSTLISTFIVFVIVGGLFYLLFYQLSIFAGDFEEIRERLHGFYKGLQQKFFESTGISPQEQTEIIRERSDSALDVAEERLTTFMGNVFTASAQFLLVLIYVFLFLLNRGKYYKFLLMYIPEEKKEEGKSVLVDTKKVVHHYLWGRIQVMFLLAIMYIITFTIFDVRYALLLTLFGAVITIIPYIGPMLSGILPVLIVIVFGRDVGEIILFASIVLFIQLIESYIMEPLILGSEVKLSPLAVIIAIIIGGMIWGIAGMILFVPIFAIIKIIGTHTPELKPLAFLLGSNDLGSESKLKKEVKSWFN